MKILFRAARLLCAITLVAGVLPASAHDGEVHAVHEIAARSVTPSSTQLTLNLHVINTGDQVLSGVETAVIDPAWTVTAPPVGPAGQLQPGEAFVFEVKLESRMPGAEHAPIAVQVTAVAADGSALNAPLTSHPVEIETTTADSDPTSAPAVVQDPHAEGTEVLSVTEGEVQ